MRSGLARDARRELRAELLEVLREGPGTRTDLEQRVLRRRVARDPYATAPALDGLLEELMRERIVDAFEGPATPSADFSVAQRSAVAWVRTRRFYRLH